MDYKERLLEEYYSLNDKIQKLDFFIKNTMINENIELKCPQFILTEQLESMKHYKDCLMIRITYENIKLEV